MRRKLCWVNCVHRNPKRRIQGAGQDILFQAINHYQTYTGFKLKKKEKLTVLDSKSAGLSRPLMRTKKERYSLCVGTVNIPQTLGQTQVKVLSGMCEPDAHGHNVSSFPFIHKGPQTLPAEREWFNSVWKHTLVSTLVTTAHVTAGGAWVCSLCFPLQGLLVSGNTNCHFPHCLSKYIHAFFWWVCGAVTHWVSAG